MRFQVNICAKQLLKAQIRYQHIALIQILETHRNIDTPLERGVRGHNALLHLLLAQTQASQMVFKD